MIIQCLIKMLADLSLAPLLHVATWELPSRDISGEQVRDMILIRLKCSQRQTGVREQNNRNNNTCSVWRRILLRGQLSLELSTKIYNLIFMKQEKLFYLHFSLHIKHLWVRFPSYMIWDVNAIQHYSQICRRLVKDRWFSSRTMVSSIMYSGYLNKQK
jgi:hypothetical protein